MSSLVTSPYSNNILACGYIREYENDTLLNGDIIPSGVQLIIAMYCRQDIVYGIGCNDYHSLFDINSNKSSYHQIHSNLINDKIINGYGININSIYSELYKFKSQHVNNNEKIQLLSTSSLLKNTDLYIYTDDNNLYKSSINTRSVSTFAKYRHNHQRNVNVSNTTSTSTMSTSPKYIQSMSLAKIEPFTDSNDIIIDIKCGLHHTLFLTKSGNVFSYGLNDVGQCGFNKDKFIHITTPKLMATNIKAIACGSFHNLLINNNDELIVCGYNYCGQLGVTTLCDIDKYCHNHSVDQSNHCHNNNDDNNNNMLPNFNSSDSGDSFTSNASSNTSNTSSTSMTQPIQQNISIRYDQFVEFEMVDTSDSDAMDDDDDTLLNGFAFQDDSDDDSDNDNDEDDNDTAIVSTQGSGTNKSANTVRSKNILTVDIPTKNRYFMDLGLKIAKIDCGKFHSLVITKDGKCFTFGSNAFGNLGNGEESEWGATNPIPHQIQIQFETEHQSQTLSPSLFPNKIESIIDGSCGENHNLLLTKSNKIIAFGDNSNHQCSMIEKDKLLKPFIISKEKELNLASNILIEKVFCSQNESLVFINPYSRCSF